MNSDKKQLLEFYQDTKTKKVKQIYSQMKIFQSMSAAAQDIAIPYAFCELCGGGGEGNLPPTPQGLLMQSLEMQ